MRIGTKCIEAMKKAENPDSEAQYKEAIEYLYSRLPMFSRVGAAAYKPGLDTSINLAKYFDNPHLKFKSIHVGGTNGKGSTSHLIASVLQSEGYKVGLYTSPHLVDFRERMKINGEMIPKEKVLEFVDNWKRAGYQGSPSFFELTMIMAFQWFTQEQVDYAVIEVGMGGRLDSTNIITPVLSVITNISKDHTQFLGDTLEKIAKEKAGIIKKGVPVVIGETQSETEDVFKKEAIIKNSPISFADQEIKDLISIEETDNGWKCQFGDMEFFLPLGGEYQKKNIMTVLEAIKKLRETGVKISSDSLKQGIEKVILQTGLAGRWMKISDYPLTIADTGHNEAGLSYNFRQLGSIMNEKRNGKLKIVIGFVADKDIDKILKLLPRYAYYFITNALIPRAMKADKLWEKFVEQGIEGKIYGNVWEAYKAAKKETSEEDVIFIGGSTFIVADFLHSYRLYDGHDS